MPIRYINGRRLKQAILAGTQKVLKSQKKINEINVYPVPDGDTGTNMASTLKHISENGNPENTEHEKDLSKLSATLADSAIHGARGNSGAIMAQFFQGLAESFDNKAKVSLEQFSDAVSKASKRAREAISNPVEGTIITVMHDWSQWIKNHWHKEDGFESLMHKSLEAAKASLKSTPDKLDALKKANVVDAGAQGFVHFLQGISDNLRSGKFNKKRGNNASNNTDFASAPGIHHVESAHQEAEVTAHSLHSGELNYKYCTECIVQGHNIDADAVKRLLREWGDSLVVVANQHKVKIHVHTNDPNRVFKQMASFGELVGIKADDMWAQYRACIDWKNSRDIALIVDSSCSIPQEYLVKYNINVIPLQIMAGDTSYLDRVNISLDKFYNLLTEGDDALSTSQPLPADITSAFNKASEHASSALAVMLSGELSGTAANTASFAERSTDFPVEVIDSRNVASGHGLIAQFAAEAIHRGLAMDEVKRIVERAVENTEVLVAPATLKYMIKGGRVSKHSGFIANLLHLLPLLTIDKAGRTEKCGIHFGVNNTRRKLLKQVFAKADTMKKPRFLVAHANVEAAAEKAAKALAKRYHLESVPTVSATPLIVTHSGPGTVAIAFCDEDILS